MRRRLLLLTLLVVAGVAGYLEFERRFPPPPPPPSRAELDALRARRELLRQQLIDLVGTRENAFAKAPKANLLIGVPTGFTNKIVQQVVTGLLGETTLTLKNLKVHKEDRVRVSMLFGKRTVGEFVIDVDIHQVQGLLKPSAPKLSFGNNRILLTLPVAVADGGGNATIRLQWDSKGLAANTVCGDVDVTREVTGTVKPAEYVVSGGFELATEGGAILLQPEFGDGVVVNIKVAASEQAIKVIEDLIEDQRAGCKSALGKIDVKQKILDIAGVKGFNVRLPAKLFRRIKLPAGIQQSLRLQGITVTVQVKPVGLVVTPERIWYGADIVAAREARASAPAAPAQTSQ